MPLTRRQFLRLSALTGASAALAGCAFDGLLHQPGATLTSWPAARNPHWPLLSRLTFGPRADELARATQIGPQAWVEEQLAPTQIDDLALTLRLDSLDTLHMDRSLLFDVREANVRRELQQAALLRAIYSRRQLYEVIVDFWSDHFSISTLKRDCAWLKTLDDREVIRPHAFGKFGDLLWASMHSPAMLLYLDNQQNRAGRPNENYARELLELHTLGVGGGYSQHDVEALARCLTGWTLDKGLFYGQLEFVPRRHDNGAKTLLGVQLPAGGGERDLERAHAQILQHPALPTFIARKLVRRLVADDPPAALVAAAANAFRQSQGDIRATLKAIVFAPELRSPPPKFKRPLPYVAGALRQLDAETNGGPPLLTALAQMGQPLFQWPTPDGFPDHTAAWNGALLARWQFALGLASGSLRGTRIDLARLADTAGATSPQQQIDQFATLLLGTALPAATNQQLAAALAVAPNDTLPLGVAALLAAPHYQWR